jgi:hypothetical protein
MITSHKFPKIIYSDNMVRQTEFSRIPCKVYKPEMRGAIASENCNFFSHDLLCNQPTWIGRGVKSTLIGIIHILDSKSFLQHI